jgi:hypothetical protein
MFPNDLVSIRISQEQPIAENLVAEILLCELVQKVEGLEIKGRCRLKVRQREEAGRAHSLREEVAKSTRDCGSPVQPKLIRKRKSAW